MAYWRRRDPALTAVDNAKKIGKHERTVLHNWRSDEHAQDPEVVVSG